MYWNCHPDNPARDHTKCHGRARREQHTPLESATCKCDCHKTNAPINKR